MDAQDSPVTITESRFSWENKTYKRATQLAFAITGCPA
jgi:hypothetical protein